MGNAMVAPCPIQVAGAAAGAGQGGESEAGERLLDAGLQAPRVGGGHGGEELVVVPGEGGLVGALGQGCAGGLEAGGERAQRRGGGVEVVARAPVHGQGVGDGRGARGPQGAGVGDEVARDQAQQRGLAAAVGADEAGPFAVADGEGDAGQQRLGGEGETEVGEGDRGHAELRSAGADGWFGASYASTSEDYQVSDGARGPGPGRRRRSRAGRCLLRSFALCCAYFPLLRSSTLCCAPFSRTMKGQEA